MMDLKRKKSRAEAPRLCRLCNKQIAVGEEYWYTYVEYPHTFMGNEHMNCEKEKQSRTGIIAREKLTTK